MANERTYSFLRQGSAILFIVVLMTLLIIALSAVWKTTVYLTDFVAEQEQFLRHRSNYISLQQYLIKFIKNNFDQLIIDINRQKKPLEVSLQWPPNNKQKNNNSSAIIEMGDNTTILFTLHYKPYNELENHLKAALTKVTNENEKPFFKISQWQTIS